MRDTQRCCHGIQMFVILDRLFLSAQNVAFELWLWCSISDRAYLVCKPRHSGDKFRFIFYDVGWRQCKPPIVGVLGAQSLQHGFLSMFRCSTHLLPITFLGLLYDTIVFLECPRMLIQLFAIHFSPRMMSHPPWYVMGSSLPHQPVVSSPHTFALWQCLLRSQRCLVMAAQACTGETLYRVNRP